MQSSIFIESRGFHKLVTCISWAALNGTEGGQHTQTGFPVQVAPTGYLRYCYVRYETSSGSVFYDILLIFTTLNTYQLSLLIKCRNLI